MRAPNLAEMRDAWRTMVKIAHEMPSVATTATSCVIRIHAADIKAISVVISPTPKQLNMNPRSACIPSTAWSIEPSLPRRALPEPQTDTNVVVAVHSKLAQMETVTNRCRHALGRNGAHNCERRDSGCREVAQDGFGYSTFWA